MKRKWTMPLTVSVRWAGDTPVIQVTKLWTPSGTYTARVLVYETHYAGFWSGGRFGGHMYGRIERATDGEVKKVQTDADQAPAGPSTGEKKNADAPGTAPKKLSASDWPQFRGAFARGVASPGAYATDFDIESGRNVLWRKPVPGLAHSSPIVVGDRVFLTTSVPEKGEAELKVGLYGNIVPVQNEPPQEMRVVCFDKRTGEQLWTKTAWKGVPAIKRHPKGSHAASTPASDGKHVVALFASEGLYCYGVDGKQLWKKSLGVLDAGYFSMPKAQWGYAASPVIHEGKVLVQCDVQGQSFLTALDVQTGETIWRTDRKEVPTWGSPTVDIANGRRQVICNGWKHIGGYDLDTGKELWKCVGGGDIPVPTPIVHDGIAYITNAHGRVAPVLAIRTSASGDFGMDASESEHMLWNWTRRGNYMQTPIAHGNELYLCHDVGVIRCLDAKSGKEIYRQRIGGGRMGFTSSPILAGGALYYSGEDGEIHAVKVGRKFVRLGLSELGEPCMASPAASNGTLFFRSQRHLVAIRPSI